MNTNWYAVTLKLSQSDRLTFAAQALEAYRSLGYPGGFLIFDFHDQEKQSYSFFFSPVSVPYFKEYIRLNKGEIWSKPIPAGSRLTVGDRNAASRFLE